MNDVLPAHISAWQHLEACAREVAGSYGYEEIRVPLIEHTELFKRAIGEFTDVVEKEMYTFTDQGGESLTLRPEATAGIVRAAISNGLLRGAATATTSSPITAATRARPTRTAAAACRGIRCAFSTARIRRWPKSS